MWSTIDRAFDTWHHSGIWFVLCLSFCCLITPFVVLEIQNIKISFIRIIIFGGINIYEK